MKDMFSQMQRVSAKGDDEPGDVDDADDVDCDQALKGNKAISGQVNILASVGQHVLEGGSSKKQVSEHIIYNSFPVMRSLLLRLHINCC